MLEPGGGGGLHTSSEGTGMIECGQKSKPQKIPGPKFNPPKIPCQIS